MGHPGRSTPLIPIRDDRGGIAIEYALLAALMAVALVGSLLLLGTTIVELPLANIVEAIEGMLE
jgi:Flp pilus assembly pilin Flp